MKKVKIILIGFLAILSISFALFTPNFKQKKENKTEVKSSVKDSTKSSVKEEAALPSETEQTEQIIWIKNLNFLSSKNEKYDVLMKLKNNLNVELKTLNKNIYEVVLIENTYKKTTAGFTIEAKADKLDGKIYIEYKDGELNFKIEH